MMLDLLITGATLPDGSAVPHSRPQTPAGTHAYEQNGSARGFGACYPWASDRPVVGVANQTLSGAKGRVMRTSSFCDGINRRRMLQHPNRFQRLLRLTLLPIQNLPVQKTLFLCNRMLPIRCLPVFIPAIMFLKNLIPLRRLI